MRSKRFKTVLSRKGQEWKDCLEPIAAIYGANASGKTSFLRALNALAQALRSADRAVLFLSQPSRTLGSASSTSYEIECVAEETPYRYSVTAESWGISFEGMYAYPFTNERVLFERKQESRDTKPSFYKGASLSGPTAQLLKFTKRNSLFLAVARAYDHDVLAPIARAVTANEGISILSYRDTTEEESIQQIILEVITADETPDELVNAILQAGDLGIERIDVQHDEIPLEVRQHMQEVLKAMNSGSATSAADEIPRLMKRVIFTHRGPQGTTFELPLGAQSSGTLTWITVAWRVFSALRKGQILLVDELDASLHRALVRYLIELFIDGRTNPKNGQIIFTTHDATLLGRAPAPLLHPQHVWFTEKDDCGQAELFPLRAFDNRAGNNSARRYLAGQFGAVANLDDILVY